ncbi:MAG TPA: hydantoinase/oxoprolinase family protein [Terriglobales bacterium]|nr:hydantoinase/oxoprolinase family protein [Terriglobales bacterium]
MRIAIDTGGTFTDCVYLNEGAPAVLKLRSTPDDPARSVLQVIRHIAGESVAEVRHGTTIGTNALLERKGARVAFVTTAGFEDTIAIGRQARQHLYDWLAIPAACIVPEELRFGVPERVSAEGENLRTPSTEELAQLKAAIRNSRAESIAISLLFSFANPENEKSVASLLGDLGIPISVSHIILPEFREYERAATIVVNAYLAPKAGAYVRRLESAVDAQNGGSLHVMQSSGGLISAGNASQEPVLTVLSGPAGGVIGAHRIAQLAGFQNIISFDMGGTSTDVSLIDSRGPQVTSESRVSEIPISVPMLDIHTIGAGGGSVAWFDRGGILHVGPQSAGADPGPICYGRGEQPTVTDANLVLGRLDVEVALAGSVYLDEARTRRFMEEARGPIASVEQFASGMLRVVEAEMEKAIRLISIERGYDPREFTLIAFGGAGPLHACALAQALKIPRVLVPVMPGALSAFGILSADVVRDYSQTVMISIARSSPQDPHLSLERFFVDLEARANTEFKQEGLAGTPIRSADLRYAGQGYEINVPAGPDMLTQFHELHHRRYGHSNPTQGVQVVNARVRVIAKSEPVDLPKKKASGSDCGQAVVKQKEILFGSKWTQAAVFDRNLLMPGNCFSGPAIVHEYTATTVVPPGCRARVDAHSNLAIEI